MDATLRELERRLTDGDEEVRDLLERRRLDAGLGWWGETLPLRDLRPDPRERNVYVLELRHGDRTHEIDFVFVPAGEVECEACAHYEWNGIECAVCRSESFVFIPGFYVQRYPTTWTDYLFHCDATGTDKPDPPPWWVDQHGHEWRTHKWDGLVTEGFAWEPVLNTSVLDAAAFCQRWGLSLMNYQQFLRAAVGGRDEFLKCHRCDGRGRHPHTHKGQWCDDCGARCRTCGGEGTVPRKYPWGASLATATELRQLCVVTSARPLPTLTWSGYGADRRRVPCRPKGLSPWGAADLAGNAPTWLADATCAGAAYFDERPCLRRREHDTRTRDDTRLFVGIRTAIRAPQEAG